MSDRKTIVITGGTHGLGLAMVKALMIDHDVISLSLCSMPDASSFTISKMVNGCGVIFLKCDVTDPQSIGKAISVIDKCDILINNAGVNKIGYLEDFAEADYDLVMDTNAKSIFLMTKAFLPLLITAEGGGTVMNIVSNAAHMPMTGSLAYNASKGAAHIMTQQLARELRPKHGITVFGIAPNRLAGTEMSKSIDEQVVKSRGWTPEYAREYQLKNMQAGEETDPAVLSDFIAYLLQSKTNHKYLTGTILPYGL